MAALKHFPGLAKSLQSNLNCSNPEGSFTMANSNSFLRPYEILPIDQENKYLKKQAFLFHYEIVFFFEAILMSTLNIQLLCRISIDFPELAIFASRPGAMINLHWLELPMTRTIFHGPKDVRAIEVRLYVFRANSSLVCQIQRVKM